PPDVAALSGAGGDWKSAAHGLICDDARSGPVPTKQPRALRAGFRPAAPLFAATGSTDGPASMSAHRHSAPEPQPQAARMAASRERRSLWIALSLTLGFAAIEAAAGWLAGSLALLSDAGHMITDSAALAIALLAQHVSQRP